MSTQISNQKSNKKKTQKKSNLPLIITAIVLVCTAGAAVALTGGKGDSRQKDGTAGGIQIISEDGYLAIPTTEIAEKAVFYPIEVDGTEMEVLAVKAGDGSIRTAFNTCQSCYLSGRGYYVQEGSDLVCQNCGFHFTPDQVEIQSGGCNPWPIFSENKTVNDDEILISYDFLKESSDIFANWKVRA